MPIQTNCAQAISIFHTPLPGTLKDVEKLRRAFAAEKLRKGKLGFVAAKNPLVHGRIYKGNRIIIQIADPLPIEVIGRTATTKPPHDDRQNSPPLSVGS